jgi:hypothetical protein
MFANVSEWLDLSVTIPIHAWAVNQIVTVSDDGSGKAILVSVGSPGDDEMEVTHFLIDPQIAHAIGWEMIGTASGYDSSPTLNGMTTTVEGHSIMDDLGLDDE